MCAFYDRVLAHFGLERAVAYDRIGPAGVFWRMPGRRWPQFVIGLPFDKEQDTVGNGTQVSYFADAPPVVDTAWHTALTNGAADAGPQGLRARYAADPMRRTASTRRATSCASYTRGMCLGG